MGEERGFWKTTKTGSDLPGFWISWWVWSKTKKYRRAKKTDCTQPSKVKRAVHKKRTKIPTGGSH
jgi:hypothetical protein